MTYSETYSCLLDIIMAILQQHRGRLGLMVPGNPTQIAVPNGIRNFNGVIVYYFLVVQNSSFSFHSARQFRNETQKVFDEFCYGNFLPKIRLMGVKSLSNGCILIAVSV